MAKIDNFLNESKASYSGLYIVNNNELLKLIRNLGSDWKRYAHHMTIKLGNLPPEIESKKGTVINITATEIGYLDDKVVAVKIETDIKTQNSFPHVTLAVNTKNGGKPFLSNSISDWQKLESPIKLDGKFAEFANDGTQI